MIIMIVLVGFVVLILTLKFLPLRQVVLNEGVFNYKDRSVDFHDNWFIVYYFDYACRECWEKNRYNWYEECHVAIPEIALKLNSFEPQKGDSVKIIGYKNIFGWVRAYKIVWTNFTEELAEKQFAREKEEREEHHLAYERRWALERGLSVEEYRRVTEEEAVEDAVKTLGISNEEVLANNYHQLPKSLLITAKKLIRKQGKLVTHHEIYEENNKWCEKTKKRVVNEKEIPGICIKSIGLLMSNYYLEFAALGKLSDKKTFKQIEIEEHLKECEMCRKNLGEARAIYLQPRGLECVSEEELELIRRTGKPSDKQKKHAQACKRCNLHIRYCENQHLKNPPGPDCLTKDDFHHIHAEGKIPENKVIHVAQCKRCEQWVEHHKQIYFDRVAPLPHLPKRRLESLRKKKARAAS